MITLSHEVARLVLPDRVQNLYLIRENHRVQLDEVKSCLKNKHLSAFTSEVTALVDGLAAQLENDEKRIVAFENAIPTLEKTIAEQVEAQSAYDLARHARGIGSMKRAEALRLRDDVEAADQVLLIRKRATAACAQLANAGLPSSAGISEGPGRDITNALASMCITRKYHPESSRGSIDRDAWDRWLEMPEHDFRWLPFHAARTIKEMSSNAGAYANDWRREPVTLPVSDFVSELVILKKARAAHIKSKVDKAQQDLEAAKERAAALVGSVA